MPCRSAVQEDLLKDRRPSRALPGMHAPATAIRRLVFISLLTTISLLTGSVFGPLHGETVEEVWKGKLAAIDGYLRRGEYEKARKKAIKLADRMVEDGSDSAYTLALTCALRAVAESGLGNETDALWYWGSAQRIFNDITHADLTPYGAAAEFLKSRPIRSRDGCGPVEDESRPTGDPAITPPRLKKRVLPRPPETWLQRTGMEAHVTVRVCLDATGHVSGEPWILTPAVAPGWAYLALDSIRRWEFEPARLEDRPVAVWYDITIGWGSRGIVRQRIDPR